MCYNRTLLLVNTAMRPNNNTVVLLFRTEWSLSLYAVTDDWIIPVAAYTAAETPNAFQRVKQPTNVALPIVGSRPHLIHCFVGPTQVSQPNGILISSHIHVTDPHTHRQCYVRQLQQIAIGCTLCTAMWPNNNNDNNNDNNNNNICNYASLSCQNVLTSEAVTLVG